MIDFIRDVSLGTRVAVTRRDAPVNDKKRAWVSQLASRAF